MTTTTSPRHRARRPLGGSSFRQLPIGAAALLVMLGMGVTEAGASTTWTAPVEPLDVVHGFDPPSGPYAPGHRGVDLAGTVGQSVGAAADGVVSYAGQVGGIGVVAVVHGRVRTTYQPLRNTVRVGTPVRGGDPLGVLAPVGSHCAPSPCLHWGAIADEIYLDPLSLLDPAPSRLLPYWGADDAPRVPGRPAGVVATETAESVVTTPVRGATAAEQTKESRALPTGASIAIAAVGGIAAAAGFLAIRRRRR